MKYISKLTGRGIGTAMLPGHKQKSLVYVVDNNTIVPIGIVRDEELFEKGINEILYYQFDEEKVKS